MVAHNFMVVTGGGDGIMGAAQRGAGRAHSFGLNIRLPSEQRANEIIEGDPKLITLNYFFTRKLNFVKEAHAFRVVSRWFWHTGRRLRGADTHANGESPYYSGGECWIGHVGVLGGLDEVY
jgi:hypothetical protein